MTEYLCPGGVSWTCGEIVEGEPHRWDASVAVLAEHGCPRKYVEAAKCVVGLMWSRELEQNVRIGWWNPTGTQAFVWFLPRGTGGCWREAGDLEARH